MDELIKIHESENGSVVSARELHSYLEVKTDFSNWCKRMFDYGLENDVDYTLVKIGEGNAHNKIDYAITIDAAKEISMLKELRAKKIFLESNTPKQNLINSGYFKVSEQIIDSGKFKKLVSTTYATSKGIGYIHKIFKTK